MHALNIPAELPLSKNDRAGNDIYRKLRQQLRQFGLNPNHWQLGRKVHRSDKLIDIEVLNRSDSHYRLLGTAEIVSHRDVFSITDGREKVTTAFWHELKGPVDSEHQGL